MADPIPNEDYITHTQLWERIDAVHDLFGGTVQGMQDHWQEQTTALKDTLQKIGEQQAMLFDKKKDSIDDSLKDMSAKIQQQLDDALAKLGQKLDEYMGRVETKFNGLQVAVYEKVDSANRQSFVDSKNTLADAKRELEVILNNTVSSMQGRITDLQRKVDIRLNGLDEATLRKAETEVEKRLSAITDQAIRVEGSVSSYQKEITDAITKFQVESMQKLGQIDTFLKEIKTKFGVISDNLK